MPGVPEKGLFLADEYFKRFPYAIRCLKVGLVDSPAFFVFSESNEKKISLANRIERLNREIYR